MEEEQESKLLFVSESELQGKIYDVLYKKSKVDGVRIVYEDEWPLTELESFVRQQQLEVVVQLLENVKQHIMSKWNPDYICFKMATKPIEEFIQQLQRCIK